jgi:hypothetical protein
MKSAIVSHLAEVATAQNLNDVFWLLTETARRYLLLPPEYFQVLMQYALIAKEDSELFESLMSFLKTKSARLEFALDDDKFSDTIAQRTVQASANVKRLYTFLEMHCNKDQYFELKKSLLCSDHIITAISATITFVFRTIHRCGSREEYNELICKSFEMLTEQFPNQN